MEQNGTYKWLGPRPGSKYQQYFVKGHGVRAQTLYRATLEPDAMTPEAVATDRGVPLEAVYEAIEYCRKNADLLHREWEEEEEIIRRNSWDQPPPGLKSRQAS